MIIPRHEKFRSLEFYWGGGGVVFFVKFLLATPDWKYGVKNFDVFFRK